MEKDDNLTLTFPPFILVS